MSKLDLIEDALRRMGPEPFEKFAGAYLIEKGYRQINPLGVVLGANKARRGTPDALVPLADGRYVFVEYTTQAGGVAAKFAGDLAKCFDEQKTGVPVGKIEEVVLCHSSQDLSSADLEVLGQTCAARGVNLNVFGGGAIAHDVYGKYPRLARDFLGVEVDTGQIVPVEEFLSVYHRSKLATRLDTEFQFRKEELRAVQDGLRAGRLVIVAGKPGVGKTRLALEACRKFAGTHRGFEVRCVFRRGPDLYSDLQAHFARPGRFLLLVDDANRISQFEYVVRLLLDQRPDQEIKVVATVRDYATGKIEEEARPLGGVRRVDVTTLKDEEVAKLVRKASKVRHPLFVERITDVARGNARLAMMAAAVLEEGGDWENLRDVSSLYDVYFGDVRRDLDALNDQVLVKVVGIVAFLRAVDRSNAEAAELIEQAFRIGPDLFWGAVERLHEMEVVDVYENEVVKVSDQVLGTYLFYLAFFRERHLDFGALLRHYYPRSKQRLMDALIPAAQAFGAVGIIGKMEPDVSDAWTALEREGRGAALDEFVRTFWFVDPTRALLHVRGLIAALHEDEVGGELPSFKPDSNTRGHVALETLVPFRHAHSDHTLAAIDLLCDLVAKRPSEVPQTLHVLIDDYGFEHTSYAVDYRVERAVNDALWERSRNGDDAVFARVYLRVASAQLQTQFHTTESRGANSFLARTFGLAEDPELRTLRDAIWGRLFVLHDRSDLREEVVALVADFVESRGEGRDREIVTGDAGHLSPFLTTALDPSRYTHSEIARRYAKLLRRCGAPIPEGFEARFDTDVSRLASLLLGSAREEHELGIGWDST